MTASPYPTSPETSINPVVTEATEMVPSIVPAIVPSIAPATESDRERNRTGGENPLPSASNGSDDLSVDPIAVDPIAVALESEESIVGEAGVEGADPNSNPKADHPVDLKTDLRDLARQKATLETEIKALQTRRDGLAQEMEEMQSQIQSQLGRMVRLALEELHDRKRDLTQAIEQLEQRKERIQAEMRQNFAGASQDLAIRVKSFKDYLVGSLQELVVAAEDLNLVPPAPVIEPVAATEPSKKVPTSPAAGDEGFKGQAREIRRLLDQYRTNPDYYGPAWQLRRTFEPIHAERVSNWFFEQGGRGAIRGLGTRSQNILVASAIISVLTEFYGEQLVTLVLANTPESLGEWRRGLQDCLGISRADFGPNQGIALYEDPDPLVQKADQVMQARDFPLVIIDEAEALIDLSLLQFPLWLAFVSDPRRQSQWV